MTLWVIFYILHTSPSLVVYKSFQLVVYSLACNCHPLLPTQYPLSLPQSPTNLSPDNTIPLCFPCLSPPKLRTPLFIGKGTTHKLKPSPYPYTAIFCNSSTALHALYSTPLTFPLHLLDSSIALTLSLPCSIHYSIPHSFLHFLSTSHSICIIVSTPLESNLEQFANVTWEQAIATAERSDIVTSRIWWHLSERVFPASTTDQRWTNNTGRNVVPRMCHWSAFSFP